MLSVFVTRLHDFGYYLVINEFEHLSQFIRKSNGIRNSPVTISLLVTLSNTVSNHTRFIIFSKTEGTPYW